MGVFNGNAFCVKQLLTALCALSMLLINVPLVNGSRPKNTPAIDIVEPIHAGAPAAPVAIFKNVWIEHHVRSNGAKGMRVHAKFTVKNGRGISCALIAYIASDTDSHPVNLVNITPAYDATDYADMTLFISYKEISSKFNLNQPGEHDLKLRVTVASQTSGINYDNVIGRSETIEFTFTKS